jgi:N utilization substance protein B
MARRSVLQLLYQIELRGGANLPLEQANQCAEEWIATARPDEATREFVTGLVYGVADRVSQLDSIIATYAVDWALDRIPIIDKNVLRLGLFEVLHRPDIPWQVSLNEAVELAKRYSTPEAAGFVNGLLAAVQQDHAAGGLSDREGNEG